MERIAARQAELMLATARVGDPSEDPGMRRMRPALARLNALGLATVDSQTGVKRPGHWQRAYVHGLATRETARALEDALRGSDTALVLVFPHGDSAPKGAQTHAFARLPRLDLTLQGPRGAREACTRQPLGCGAKFSEMWGGLLPELLEELEASEGGAAALSRLRARCRRESVQVFAFDPRWGRAAGLFEELARALRRAPPPPPRAARPTA